MPICQVTKFTWAFGVLIKPEPESEWPSMRALVYMLLGIYAPNVMHAGFVGFGNPPQTNGARKCKPKWRVGPASSFLIAAGIVAGVFLHFADGKVSVAVTVSEEETAGCRLFNGPCALLHMGMHIGLGCWCCFDEGGGGDCGW